MFSAGCSKVYGDAKRECSIEELSEPLIWPKRFYLFWAVEFR